MKKLFKRGIKLNKQTFKKSLLAFSQLMHKFKILTFMQLSEKVKIHSTSTKTQKAAFVAKNIFGLGVIFGIFFGVFTLIFKLMNFPTGESTYIFFMGLLSIFSIVSSIITVSRALYLSKDNALLLTYPVSPWLVFLSKITVSYLIELKKSLFLILPIMMGYMAVVTEIASVNYVIGAIVFSIFLPLIPVLLGSLIAIPFVYITKIFKKATWVKGIFTLILFAGLIVLSAFVVRNLPQKIEIVGGFNTLREQIINFFDKANPFMLYANFVGRIMYGHNVGINYLYFFLIVFGLLIVCPLLAMPTFYKLASSATENSVQKVYKGKNKAHSNTFITFLRKEVTLSLRNLGDFASSNSFLFALPFILIIVASIYTHIERNNMGYSLTYGFIGLISLVVLSASNTASATAISSEGNEFVLLKTAPGKTTNIIWSKLLVNFIISTIMLLISFILLNVLLNDFIEAKFLWLTFAFSLLIDLGLILWSIQIDILNPKLKEYANSENRGELKNFSSSILIGCVVSLIFSIILIALLISVLPTFAKAIILVFIGLLFVGARLFFLISYTNAYFDDIQL